MSALQNLVAFVVFVVVCEVIVLRWALGWLAE